MSVSSGQVAEVEGLRGRLTAQASRHQREVAMKEAEVKKYVAHAALSLLV